MKKLLMLLIVLALSLPAYANDLNILVATGTYGLSPPGTGTLDAFVANSGANKIWVNDGAGNFSDSGQDLGTSGASDVGLGDLDGDGDLDAFVANGSGSNNPQPNKVWLNVGQGFFSDSGQNVGNSDSMEVELGDLDGDGDLDAFVVNWNEPDKVWLNDGTGTFIDSGQGLDSETASGVALGDLDGDDDLDAFVANQYGDDKVWVNDGAGNFSDSGQSLGGWFSGTVALGDVDGDGDLDAFVAIGVGDADKVWLNDGAGHFSDSGQSLGSSNSHDVELGDLDGDGDLDAFVVTYQDQADKVWLNDGAGNFIDSGQSLVDAEDSDDVELGDLDGDGDLDAFVANRWPRANKVWLNDGAGNFSDSGQSLGSSSSGGVALGDLDGPDILVYKTTMTGPRFAADGIKTAKVRGYLVLAVDATAISNLGNGKDSDVPGSQILYVKDGRKKWRSMSGTDAAMIYYQPPGKKKGTMFLEHGFSYQLGDHSGNMDLAAYGRVRRILIGTGKPKPRIPTKLKGHVRVKGDWGEWEGSCRLNIKLDSKRTKRANREDKTIDQVVQALDNRLQGKGYELPPT